MKIEDQVCNLELSKRLKELGVKQESFCFWYEGLAAGPTIIYRSGNVEELTYSAFTVAELGQLLPPDTPSDQTACWMQVSVDGGETYWDNLNDGDGIDDPHIVRGGTEADLRAKMLIYLIEQNLLKP